MASCSSPSSSDGEFDCDFYNTDIAKTKDKIKALPSNIFVESYDLDREEREFEGSNKAKKNSARSRANEKNQKELVTSSLDDSSLFEREETPRKVDTPNESINITPPGSPRSSSAVTGVSGSLGDENEGTSPARFTRSRRGKRKYDPRGSSVSLRPADTKMNRKTQKALKLIDAQKAKSSKTARALSNLDNYEETFDLDDSDYSDELLEGGDSIQIKVQWKHQVLRIKAKKHQPLLEFFRKVSEEIEQPISRLTFRKDGHLLNQKELMSKYDIGITSIIMVTLKVKADLVDGANLERIQLKCQSRDKKSSVTVSILRGENMEALVKSYARLKNIPDHTKLKFIFDGEELDPEDTTETLELEGGECFDVY